MCLLNAEQVLEHGTCACEQSDPAGLTAGHERPPSARTAQEATQSQGGEDAKRKHRRNRSLGSLGGILSLKSRGKDEKGKVTPHALTLPALPVPHA